MKPRPSRESLPTNVVALRFARLNRAVGLTFELPARPMFIDSGEKLPVVTPATLPVPTGACMVTPGRLSMRRA